MERWENGKYYELHDFDGVVDSFNYRITAEGVTSRKN
jgi:hypothetical protein